MALALVLHIGISVLRVLKFRSVAVEDSLPLACDAPSRIRSRHFEGSYCIHLPGSVECTGP
jgi:hypothetical protein